MKKTKKEKLEKVLLELQELIKEQKAIIEAQKAEIESLKQSRLSVTDLAKIAEQSTRKQELSEELNEQIDYMVELVLKYAKETGFLGAK